MRIATWCAAVAVLVSGGGGACERQAGTSPQLPPGTRVGYYVTTAGSSSGDGTSANPWDLGTALSGAGGRVHAGDTIWVRAGTYVGTYNTNLSGSAAAPIIVRAYTGERVIIDGNDGSGNDGFVVHGSYTWYWGLELRNSDPTRTTTSTSSNFRPDVVANNGTHIKYINLVIHDGGVGFYTYTAMADVEISGSILYNNGWQGPDRGHGHGLYLKNDVGPVVARDNVIFNQFGYGIHIYSDVGDGQLNGISAIGNVSFDNGSLASTGPSAEIGNLGQMNANNLVVTSNLTYVAPTVGGSNVVLGSGDGLTASGNYVAGGDGISQGTWTNATVTSNTVIPPDPTQTAVFVEPNAYEPGRAFVVVFNWANQASASVDLSGVLQSGDAYEVRNVQDLFGTPGASGTYGGGSVSIPLTAVAPPAPIGISSLAPTTGPGFNVYLVVRTTP
jgi:hypothetical protein